MLAQVVPVGSVGESQLAKLEERLSSSSSVPQTQRNALKLKGAHVDMITSVDISRQQQDRGTGGLFFGTLGTCYQNVLLPTGDARQHVYSHQPRTVTSCWELRSRQRPCSHSQPRTAQHAPEQQHAQSLVSNAHRPVSRSELVQRDTLSLICKHHDLFLSVPCYMHASCQNWPR